MEKVKQISQGVLHPTSISSGTLKATRVDAVSIEWDGATYEGSYTITPSGETQTLPTYGRLLTNNIVVNPIPNNYGLITYNGSTITVS